MSDFWWDLGPTVWNAVRSTLHLQQPDGKPLLRSFVLTLFIFKAPAVCFFSPLFFSHISAADPFQIDSTFRFDWRNGRSSFDGLWRYENRTQRVYVNESSKYLVIMKTAQLWTCCTCSHTPVSFIYAGSDFDVDQFVVHAIGQLGANSESDAASADASSFDPDAILGALLVTKIEVGKLRVDADTRLSAGVHRVDTLLDRHTRGVQSLRQDTDQVLRTVQDLQGTVGTMGAKAVTMGRQLDKIDQQRRRACDAAQAIRYVIVTAGLKMAASD